MFRRLVALLTLALILFAAPSGSAQLRAGAAKASIVPPFPTHMGGFGDRMQPFEGVHDELYARAVAIDNGETSLVIIASDLMALDEELTARVRQRVESATGTPGNNILISCAHNHSAPSYYQYDEGPEREKALAFFVEQFTSAAVAAHTALEPAQIGYANGSIEGASNNRQQQNTEVIDTQVGVLRIERGDTREVIANIFNFTAHPVIVGSENLQLSGEFPGEAARAVEKALGGVALFTQGACGDVTIQRSGDPFAEVLRVGTLVAGEVIKTSSTIRTSPDVQLASAYVEIPLEPKALPNLQAAAQRVLEAKSAEQLAKTAEASRSIMRAHQRRIQLLQSLQSQAERVADGSLVRPESYTGSVHVLQIGEMVMVGIPGELFVEYALEMRQRVHHLTEKSMWLVGYANGYLGYIVTPRAMETGGYEASVARVDYHSGRILTERAMALVAAIVH